MMGARKGFGEFFFHLCCCDKIPWKKETEPRKGLFGFLGVTVCPFRDTSAGTVTVTFIVKNKENERVLACLPSVSFVLCTV